MNSSDIAPQDDHITLGADENDETRPNLVAFVQNLLADAPNPVSGLPLDGISVDVTLGGSQLRAEWKPDRARIVYERRRPSPRRGRGDATTGARSRSSHHVRGGREPGLRGR